MAFRACRGNHRLKEPIKRTRPFEGKRRVGSNVGASVAVVVDDTQLLLKSFLFVAVAFIVYKRLAGPEGDQALELLHVRSFDSGHRRNRSKWKMSELLLQVFSHAKNLE